MFSNRVHGRALLCLGLVGMAAACSSKKKLTISAAEKVISQESAIALAADQDSLYWFADGAVRKTPRGSPSAPGVVLAEASFVLNIIVDADNVYWTDLGTVADGEIQSNTGSVVKVAKTGGAPVTIASGEDFPRTIAVDANNVYWANFTQARKAPLSLGEPTTIGTGEHLTGIAVDDQFVYWNDGQSTTALDGVMKKANIITGETSIIYNDLTAPGPLLREGDDVIWIDYGTYVPDASGAFLQFNGQIMHRSMKTATLAAYAQKQQSPVALVSANGVLFWTNAEENYMGKTYAGSVMLYGPRGVQAVAENQHDPFAIAAVDGDVYWTTSAGIMHAHVE